ncbi:MAG: tRNA epoxyqueuosine(34) reductase QueG [Pseudomonadota bacterium]
MARHGLKRARPAELLPGTCAVLTAYMPYMAQGVDEASACLADPLRAYVSRYALGRDYHKVLRQRLQALLDWLCETWPEDLRASACRVFTDSAPVMEVALASQAGLGWRGKNTLLLNREAGSLFFLGEIFLPLALAPTTGQTARCGSCTACIDLCPTQAITAPYELDARRCISYLTIEQDGPIPLEFRVAMGNRIYGCDDCQLVCPWNKFAQTASVPDFGVRHELNTATLLQLFAWTVDEFAQRTEGSAIRRIGYRSWQRNLLIALGNAWRESGDPCLYQALANWQTDDEMLQEHRHWALQQRASAPALS